jgi:glyoxylase-like metal-dependent hydrolase (beta-lactamase superfamily II)
MAGEVWNIGGVKVSRFVEIEVPGGMQKIIPEATRERVREIKWLQPHFCDASGRMIGSIHALIVDTGDRRIMVDTCVGNDKSRPLTPQWNMLQTRFLEDISVAGYAPETIDTVLCTHLHLDHVGWNTRRVGDRWIPTFPNARYLIARAEYEYSNSGGVGDMQRGVLADSVEPVFSAGLVDLVETDHRVCPEVRFLPSHGHTPGHVSVLIESQGASALITGDFLHHPCQLAHPEWSSVADSDAEAARTTRRALLERYAETPTLVIGTHFATPTAGRLKRDGSAWRLELQ